MKRLGWLVAATALALGSVAPTLRADLAPGPGEGRRRPLDERLQRRLQHLQQRADGPHSAEPATSASPPPVTSGSASPPAAVADDLARKWAALAATRGERRERHRAALLHDVGTHLGDPDVKAELALHATREADLGRMQFLAQNARSGAARDQLLARLAKLSGREAERHRAKMAKLLASHPPTEASAMPSAAAAPPVPAPSAEAPR